MSGSEWRWAIGWGLVVVALSGLPYLYAAWAPPSDHVFGGFLVNVSDGNSYLAKMRQGYEGDWLFKLPFTPEDQRGLMVFTLYLGLGHLARLMDLPLALVFHFARLLCGLFLLLSAYRLAAELTADLAARRWAFAVTAFGSGLAVISLLMGRSSPEGFVPVDLFVPEAVGFYSILSNPHFCLAFALEAWAILWTLNPPRSGLALQCLVAAWLGLAIASLAPYLAPVAAVIALAGLVLARPARPPAPEPERPAGPLRGEGSGPGTPFLASGADAGVPALRVWTLRAGRLIRRDAVARWAAMAAAMAAFLLYATLAMRSDPAVAEWASQNLTPTPPPLDVILGLGLWLPLALLGAWRVYKSHGLTPVLAALAAWLLVTAVLLYVPYQLQRRFIGGVFLPLAVLSGAGVAWALGRVGRWRLPTVAGLIVFGFTANVLVMLALFSAPASAETPVYLTREEAEVLRWLEARVTPGDVVLADTRVGLFVPGWTGARTVYGHPMETIEAAVKRAEVESYYERGAADDMLARYRVTYIIGGPAPAGWRPLFESGGMTVYGR